MGTSLELVAFTLKCVNFTSQKLLVVLGVDLPYDRPGADRTPEGLRKSEYENYMQNLVGDKIQLPIEKRVAG